MGASFFNLEHFDNTDFKFLPCSTTLFVELTTKLFLTWASQASIIPETIFQTRDLGGAGAVRVRAAARRCPACTGKHKG